MATSSAKTAVTQGQFTPRTNRLANYTKSVVRQQIALENAFPEDRDKVVWEALLGAAQSQHLTEVVERISGNNTLSIKAKEMLLKYVSVVVRLCMGPNCVRLRVCQVGNTISGLRGELKNKTRQQICGHYKISGDNPNQSNNLKEVQETVRNNVAWLLLRVNFVCGGLVIEVSVRSGSHSFFAFTITSSYANYILLFRPRR